MNLGFKQKNMMMNTIDVDGKMIIRSEYMIFVVSFNHLIC